MDHKKDNFNRPVRSHDTDLPSARFEQQSRLDVLKKVYILIRVKRYQNRK